MFHTFFNVLGVLIIISFVHKIGQLLLRIFKEKDDKDIDEPKFLNEAVLQFPGSTITALLNESKYLYKNAVFEIVTHGLNIHRDDVKSEEKIKKIVKKSVKILDVNIDAIYLKKIKSIYGEIIRYAATAQNNLKLNAVGFEIKEVKVNNLLLKYTYKSIFLYIFRLSELDFIKDYLVWTV